MGGGTDGRCLQNRAQPGERKGEETPGGRAIKTQWKTKGKSTAARAVSTLLTGTAPGLCAQFPVSSTKSCAEPDGTRQTTERRRFARTAKCTQVKPQETLRQRALRAGCQTRLAFPDTEKSSTFGKATASFKYLSWMRPKRGEHSKPSEPALHPPAAPLQLPARHTGHPGASQFRSLLGVVCLINSQRSDHRS